MYDLANRRQGSSQLNWGKKNNITNNIRGMALFWKIDHQLKNKRIDLLS